MFDFKKALESVLNDPLLADVTAPRKRPTSSDRLIAGFQEILAFVEANGRLPEKNPDESSLYRHWRGILKFNEKIERCRPFDYLGILPQPENQEGPSKEDQLVAVLNDPLFADVDHDNTPDLFDIPEYMRKRLSERKEADYIGSRRPCEDFEQFADGFKEILQGLKSGKYQLVKFREAHLKVGKYFVEQGIIGYLAAFENEKRRKKDRADGRTRVIYENGSEADIKFRTITKNLAVDGYSIVDRSDISVDEFKITETDVESGIIYVLRSKSTRPEIAAIKDLYKIGFTATSLESRIANASNEPTYLCAPIEVVASWKVYNVKSSTFEALIHKLFAAVQLQITVDGHRPKEWFIVPFKIIEQAVTYIIARQPILYDPQLQQLVLLSSPQN